MVGKLIGKVELGIILIVLLFYIQPIIGNDYFLTQDGPSHVYNSYVLKSLLLGNEPNLQAYYTYELKNSPNWTVNLLYLALLSVFSTTISYKIIHLLICLLLPASIFYLINQVKSDNNYLVLFSIPFVYTLSYVIGFNNFCFGLAFTIFSYGYWLKNKEDTSVRSLVFLFLLSVLLYYTHLFSICLFLLLVGITTINSTTNSIKFKENFLEFKKEVKQRKVLLKLLPFTMVSILVVAQLIPSTATNEDIGTLSNLWRMKNMNVFSTSKEVSYSKILSISLFSLSFLGFFFRKNSSKYFQPSWIAVIILLFLYLYAPNKIANGYFVTNRLELIFYIFLILALATISFPRWFKWVLIPLSLFICWGFFTERNIYFTKMSDEIKSFQEVSEKIEDHSTLLYLCFNPSGYGEFDGAISPSMGMFHHADCFVAMAKKDVVILKNYETLYDYFPIKWKEEKSPYVNKLACAPYTMEFVPPCVYVENYNKGDNSVDYILVYKNADYQGKTEEETKTQSDIENFYEQISVSTTGTIKLYRKRS